MNTAWGIPLLRNYIPIYFFCILKKEARFYDVYLFVFNDSRSWIIFSKFAQKHNVILDINPFLLISVFTYYSIILYVYTKKFQENVRV